MVQHYLSIRVRIKVFSLIELNFFSREMSAVGIFCPGTAQTGFFKNFFKITQSDRIKKLSKRRLNYVESTNVSETRY